MKISLKELADRFELEHIGQPNHEVNGVATLVNATATQLSFCANSKYLSKLVNTQAGIVILNNDVAAKYHGNKLIAQDPYLAFAKIATLFQSTNSKFSGIHATAIIANTAKIGRNVSIGAYSIIGENTIIGDNTLLESRVTIGNNCKIGQACIVKPHVAISDDIQIGNRVIFHPGCIIGADGFGLARDKDNWLKVPQLGSVIISDDCEIGANTTIDRGTLDDTILEKDVHLDNQIQIAHNVSIGEHTVMAGCSAVAGSAKIGKNCLIGGGVGIIGHLEVCDNVTLQSMALVTHSIKKPGSYSSVAPIQETNEWRKSAVRIKQLDNIARRLKKLEREKS